MTWKRRSGALALGVGTLERQQRSCGVWATFPRSPGSPQFLQACACPGRGKIQPQVLASRSPARSVPQLREDPVPIATHRSQDDSQKVLDSVGAAEELDEPSVEKSRDPLDDVSRKIRNLEEQRQQLSRKRKKREEERITELEKEVREMRKAVRRLQEEIRRNDLEQLQGLTVSQPTLLFPGETRTKMYGLNTQQVLALDLGAAAGRDY